MQEFSWIAIMLNSPGQFTIATALLPGEAIFPRADRHPRDIRFISHRPLKSWIAVRLTFPGALSRSSPVLPLYFNPRGNQPLPPHISLVKQCSPRAMILPGADDFFFLAISDRWTNLPWLPGALYPGVLPGFNYTLIPGAMNHCHCTSPLWSKFYRAGAIVSGADHALKRIAFLTTGTELQLHPCGPIKEFSQSINHYFSLPSTRNFF